MMDSLLGMLEVPVAGHGEAAAWRSHGITDFEDALQMASAVAGRVDIFLTRNLADFSHCEMAVMTPEQFLTAFPGSQ